MSLRVSLAPAASRRHDPDATATPAAPPLLAPAGPAVVLGPELRADGLAAPIAPDAATLFGPRGACLAAADGPLYVCDTGHHRLLGYHRVPHADHAPADFVIGQPDFRHEGRNAKGDPGLATLNVPTGVAAARGVLAVADAWNHRVLLWHDYPRMSNRPADVVLGQAGADGALANRGGADARADTLNWCYGVAILGERLVVADTGNRRVLVWHAMPQRHGQPADLVLGQRDLQTRDENAGADPGPLGMRWPHAVAAVGDGLCVADAGNNRIMVWLHWPQAPGAACDFVLGQPDCTSTDHNRRAYAPTAFALNMPYGVALLEGRLAVADTANSRVLGYVAADLAPDAPATRLAGQPGFTDKGDNRWRAPVRDSLCWPYGITACERTLVVADSGNNRVLLWSASE
jgi:hypothetical protein